MSFLVAHPTVGTDMTLHLHWNGSHLAARPCDWRDTIAELYLPTGLRDEALAYIDPPTSLQLAPTGIAFGSGAWPDPEEIDRAWIGGASNQTPPSFSEDPARLGQRLFDACPMRRLAFYESILAAAGADGLPPWKPDASGVVFAALPLGTPRIRTPFCYWSTCPVWQMSWSNGVSLFGLDGAVHGDEAGDHLVLRVPSGCEPLLAFDSSAVTTSTTFRSSADEEERACVPAGAQPSPPPVFTSNAISYAIVLGAIVALVLSGVLVCGALRPPRSAPVRRGLLLTCLVTMAFAVGLQLTNLLRTAGFLGNMLTTVLLPLTGIAYVSDRLAFVIFDSDSDNRRETVELASHLSLVSLLTWQLHIFVILFILDNQRMLDGQLARVAIRFPAAAFAVCLVAPATFHCALRFVSYPLAYSRRSLGGFAALIAALSFVNVAIACRFMTIVCAQIELLYALLCLVVTTRSSETHARGGFSAMCDMLGIVAWIAGLTRYSHPHDAASTVHLGLVAFVTCVARSLRYCPIGVYSRVSHVRLVCIVSTPSYALWRTMLWTLGPESGWWPGCVGAGVTASVLLAHLLPHAPAPSTPAASMTRPTTGTGTGDVDSAHGDDTRDSTPSVPVRSPSEPDPPPEMDGDSSFRVATVPLDVPGWARAPPTARWWHAWMRPGWLARRHSGSLERDATGAGLSRKEQGQRRAWFM